MKKILILLGMAAVFSVCAFADTVTVTTVTIVRAGISQKIVQTKEIGFAPTARTIEVRLGGKVCTWVSSLAGNVPQGCNYAITINTGDGMLSHPKSLNNPVCTHSAEMLAACN
jgi:hypothetical protein